MTRYRTRMTFTIEDPTGQWDRVGADRIEWEIATDSGFTSIVKTGSVSWTDRQRPILVDIDTIGPIYARYRIHTTYGYSQWSDVVSCDLDTVI